MPSEVLPDPGTMEAFRQRQGELLRFEVTGSLAGSAWGTDIYTDDSRLAVAAVHAGRVSPGEKAIVTVLVLPGLQSYQGSRRNGVSTSAFGRWSGSFTFVGRPGSREPVASAIAEAPRHSVPEQPAVAAAVESSRPTAAPAAIAAPSPAPAATHQATPTGPVQWTRPSTPLGPQHFLGRIPAMAIKYRALDESALEARANAPTTELNRRFHQMRSEIRAEWANELAQYVAANPFPENIPFEVEGTEGLTVEGVGLFVDGEGLIKGIHVTLTQPMRRRGVASVFFVGLDSQGNVIIPTVALTSKPLSQDLPAGSSLVLESRWDLLRSLIYMEDCAKLRFISRETYESLSRQARHYVFNLDLTPMEELLKRN